MDTDQLIKTARARFDHERVRKILKEKYQAKMIFTHAGGMWQAGPDLLCLLVGCNPTDPVVILDLYETPIKILAPELYAKAHAHWQEQMNAWLLEFEQLRDQR